MRYKEMLKILDRLKVSDDEKFLLDLMRDEFESSIRFERSMMAFVVGAVVIGLFCVALFGGF